MGVLKLVWQASTVSAGKFQIEKIIIYMPINFGILHFAQKNWEIHNLSLKWNWLKIGQWEFRLALQIKSDLTYVKTQGYRKFQKFNILIAGMEVWVGGTYCHPLPPTQPPHTRSKNSWFKMAVITAWKGEETEGGRVGEGMTMNSTIWFSAIHQ